MATIISEWDSDYFDFHEYNKITMNHDEIEL